MDLDYIGPAAPAAPGRISLRCSTIRAARAMVPLAVAAAFLVSAAAAAPAAPSARPVASASPAAGPEAPVILFLVDNSASLPPLDPEEKRVAALEKMFSFLQGQRYRLVLFGGRREVFVDDVSQYRNDGQWTDYYFAFTKARELMQGYRAGTEFRMILVTDAILDPDPADWADMEVPAGVDLRAHVVQQSLGLVREMKVPLYVVLIGDAEGGLGGDERAPGMVMDLVRAANGPAATPMAQTVASFFDDNGVLLKKFIFRVTPQEGLKKVEPVVRRITASPRRSVEAQFLSLMVLPLLGLVALLLGILVRSFPGPGDMEVLELTRDTPLHVAADRLHRVDAGGWSAQGLSLVAEPKDATATFAWQTPQVDLTGKGLDLSGADDLTCSLLALDLDELRRALAELSSEGSKEHKIHALNLDYVARNLDGAEARRILSAPVAERRKIPALEFLRAKAHLLSNDELRKALTEPRVQLTTYGRENGRQELGPGGAAQVGPYTFLVKDVTRGGRKDVRLFLYYDRVPSLLGLKSWLPDAVQRAIRFRRSTQRLVS
jgi:hypothetical protein